MAERDENNQPNERDDVDNQIASRSSLLEYYSGKSIAQAGFFIAISIGLFSLLSSFDSKKAIYVNFVIHSIFCLLIYWANYCLLRFRKYSRDSNDLDHILRIYAGLPENIRQRMDDDWRRDQRNRLKRFLLAYTSNSVLRKSIMILTGIIPFFLYIDPLSILGLFIEAIKSFLD